MGNRLALWSRRLSIATALTAVAAPVQAQPPSVSGWRFDGAIRYSNASQACQWLFGQSNDRISYFPLRDGHASTLTLSRPNALATYLQTNSGQLNGSGNFLYFSAFYGVPVYDPDNYNDKYFSGSYNLVQTPAVVTENTPFVTIAGTITNYFIPGCEVDVKATLTRAENVGEVPAPLPTPCPYPYCNY